MARYKMTVVFDVHEEVEMTYDFREDIGNDKGPLPYEPLKRSESTAIVAEEQPHINKLYDDVIERIEASYKHPITYDIVSFETLNRSDPLGGITMPTHLNDLRANPEAYQAMEKAFHELREKLIDQKEITTDQKGMFLVFKGDISEKEFVSALMTSDELNALPQAEYEEILYIIPPPA